jgi:hypothetical protein
MSERLFQNNKAVNRLAKQFLLQVKRAPDPMSLYCLQLAIWGLEEGGLTLGDEYYEIEETLPAMLQWDQAKVMRLLERIPGEKERIDLLVGYLPTDTPEDLAWVVLDHLRDTLAPAMGLEREPTRD